MQLPDKSEFLNHSEGICPICFKVVEGSIVTQEKAVYLRKMCPDHGPSTTYIWPDADHYKWMNAFRVPFSKSKTAMAVKDGCPLDCGLCSDHLRRPTLVEIEVTQRCNLRCPVCFMAAGNAVPDPDLETLQEMARLIVRLSGSHIGLQLTGGEPTVRKDLPDIVRLFRAEGITAIEINSNGLAIGKDPALIYRLANAGITGIYLQFDGLSDRVYEKIRGAALLEDKLRAIENCRAAGVQVVLAMTVIWGINHDQLGDVLDFALNNKDVIAGVAYQPAFTSGRFEVDSIRRLTMGDVIFMLAEQSEGKIKPYDLWPLGCSHPLCSCSTFLVSDQGEYQPLTRLITPQEYVQSFDSHSPQGSVFADIAAKKFPSLDDGLSIVIMNYMDAMCLDLKRLKECSMLVAMQDGRQIPFCAYQLTDSFGKRLYPFMGKKVSDFTQEIGYV